MLLWGFGLDVAPVDSCSHSERSVVLLTQDIFLPHVVVRSASAWRLASFPELQGWGQVENDAAHVIIVRHKFFLCVGA